MEGLAAAGSVIAVVQIAAEITKLCGGYIRDVHHAPQDIQRLQSKVAALCHVLQKLQQRPQLQDNDAAINQCSSDLRSIKEKLEPSKKHKAMKRVGMRALKWPFTSREVEEKVKILEGYLLIFNTTLQLDIGEKVTSAEDERSMAKLAYVSDAPFNSYVNQRHRPCLENTRVEVLKDIVRWATGPSPQRIFWLNGMAGTGKSTVAISVASRLRQMSKCLASFFFRRGFGDLAHARMLVPTIAHQFSLSSSAYRHLVLAAIKEDPDLGQSVNLRDQYEKLIIEPLRTLQSSIPTPYPFFVVIDALDECDEEKDLRLLLRLLATTKDMPSLHLRVVVTSRPEWVIQQGFQDMPSILYQDLVLNNVPRKVVNRDIENFLRHELELVQRDRSLSVHWPEDSSITTLVRKAAGLFIFAATACRYIAGSPLADPCERLEQICSFVAQNHLMTEELDQMYTIVLQNSTKGKYTGDERKRIAFRFRRIVGSIVVLLNPLPLSELYKLLRDALLSDQRQLEDTLRPLHAVIDVPKDTSQSVEPLHLSFCDFLLDQNRCLDTQFLVDKRYTHQELAWDCLRLLSASLRRNVCHLPSSTTLVAEIAQSHINNALSLAVQYACRYWATHVQEGKVKLLDDDRIYKFLRSHFLHWLEAMSLTGKTSEAIVAITDLAALADSQKAPVLFDFIYDCRRFLLAFRQVISSAPGQLYHSALFFSPLQSTIRRSFSHLVPILVTLKAPMQQRWSASLQALEGHSNSVTTVVFSPDGQFVASGSGDHTIRLWNVQTGDSRAVLEGHSDSVTTVVFSPDGQLVASGSGDRTIRLWNVQTGDSRAVLEGHSNWVTTVVFSPDGQLVASGSSDSTVRLWDVQTGDSRAVLEGHSDWVTTVVFSPDGQLVASGSWDHTVRLWDVRKAKHKLSIPLQSTLKHLEFGLDLDTLFIDGTAFCINSAGLATMNATQKHNIAASNAVIFVSGEWVMKSTFRLLWLPPEYRPYTQASHGNTIVFGFRDGRVMLLSWDSFSA